MSIKSQKSMNIFHKSSQKLLKYSKNSGFTLTELLISSFMGILVIGAVGYGLTNMLRGSRSNTVQTNKRTEFNRATSFISDEMRRANHIDVDPSTAYTNTLTELGISAPPNAQPILALNIPGVSHAAGGIDKPIIYLVSDPASGDASVWSGPKVIYRIGPPSDNNGNFTNGTWTLEPLVDGISNTASNPTCDTGWTASPASDAKGFYACIQPIATTDDAETPYDDTQQGETARLFAIGQLDPNNPNSTDYEANTQVFARAEEENLDGSDRVKVSNGVGPCTFNVDGEFVCPGGGGGESNTFTLERLSDAFACNIDGDRWKVLVSAYYKDDSDTNQYFDLTDGNGTTENVDLSDASTNFQFVADAGQAPIFQVVPDIANSPTACTGPRAFPSAIQYQKPLSSFSADNPERTDDDPQLRDPDDSPEKFKLLEDADIIDEILTNAAFEVADENNAQQSFQEVLDSEGLIDYSQNNKVNTGDDYLLVFEIGQDYDTRSNGDPNTGFDFQDQVLKINVE